MPSASCGSALQARFLLDFPLSEPGLSGFTDFQDCFRINVFDTDKRLSLRYYSVVFTRTTFICENASSW